MKFTSTLIAVKNMDASRQFYRDVLGLNVVADFGANVTLDGGLVLQTLDSWKRFIRTEQVVLPNNAGELYLEKLLVLSEKDSNRVVRIHSAGVIKAMKAQGYI